LNTTFIDGFYDSKNCLNPLKTQIMPLTGTMKKGDGKLLKDVGWYSHPPLPKNQLLPTAITLNITE
jgi:hypothetical protein